MEFSQIAEIVGKKGTISVLGLTIEVEVTGHKFSYGRNRWHVKPVAGTGLAWVEDVIIDGQAI